jgi:uncharacterized protein (DUF433 family)
VRTHPQKRDLSLYGGKDPRDLPIYSVDEAAHIVRLPSARVREWATDRKSHIKGNGKRRTASLILLPDTSEGLLSFINVIEAHILKAVQQSLGAPAPKLKAALVALRKDFATQHPLAALDLYGEGAGVLAKLAAHLKASDDEQHELHKIAHLYLARIEWEGHRPMRLYPFLSEPRIDGAVAEHPKLVSVNPFVSFGRPTVAGTNIHTEAIADLFFAGESVEELARDYALETSFIEAAVRYEGSRLAGKAAA